MTFIKTQQVVHDPQPWGVTDWYASPELTGSRQLVVVQITIDPGQGHAFHMHSDQEEAIVVLEGTLTQWVGEERQQLLPGEAVHVTAGIVHASLNETDRPVRAIVTLGPCVGDTNGYVQVDKSDEEPWRTLGATP